MIRDGTAEELAIRYGVFERTFRNYHMAENSDRCEDLREILVKSIGLCYDVIPRNMMGKKFPTIYRRLEETLDLLTGDN